jgi:hypothetical protein
VAVAVLVAVAVAVLVAVLVLVLVAVDRESRTVRGSKRTAPLAMRTFRPHTAEP